MSGSSPTSINARLTDLAPNAPASQRAQRKRPRVLVLAQLPPPEHGASAVNKQVVNSTLLAKSFEVQVAPISMAVDLERIRRFEFAKVARSLNLYWNVARRLLGPARPDLIYISLSPYGWAFYRDLFLIALFRVAGTPHVFHLHGRGIAASIEKAPWLRFLYRFAFARAFVIALGGTLGRDVEDFVRRDRIFIVPNGVRDAAPVERRYDDHKSCQPPKILFLSNMLEAKGPLVLLAALAQLARRGLAFEAQFAGAWRGSVSPETFWSLVRELGLQGRVTHLGPLYDDAKARAFANADVFALPTHYENEALPLVIIEAMMHRLPVVTTRIGALPDIVVHGENGELIEPGNVGELAAALERLLRSAELRARYGRASRTKYEAELTDTRFEERLVDVLSQAAALSQSSISPLQS